MFIQIKNLRFYSLCWCFPRFGAVTRCHAWTPPQMKRFVRWITFIELQTQQLMVVRTVKWEWDEYENLHLNQLFIIYLHSRNQFKMLTKSFYLSDAVVFADLYHLSSIIPGQSIQNVNLRHFIVKFDVDCRFYHLSSNIYLTIPG